MLAISRIFYVFYIFCWIFLVDVKCQTTSEVYNGERNGFGSINDLETSTTMGENSDGLVISVNNQTLPTGITEDARQTGITEVTPIYQDPVYLGDQIQQQNVQPLQQENQQPNQQGNQQQGQQDFQQSGQQQQPNQQGFQQQGFQQSGQQNFQQPNQQNFQQQSSQGFQQPNQQGFQQSNQQGFQQPGQQQQQPQNFNQFQQPNNQFNQQNSQQPGQQGIQQQNQQGFQQQNQQGFQQSNQQGFQQPGQQGIQQQNLYYSPDQLYTQNQNYQPVQSGYQQNPQFQQNQQGQGQGCSLNGCQPPQVNQQEYFANADQYSYPNINFGYQPQQFSGQQNSGPINGQVNGSPNNQPNFQQPQFEQNFNGGVGGPVGGAIGGITNGNVAGTPPSPIQKLNFVNIVNDTNGRPVVESVSMTKVGNSVSNITVQKTELPNQNSQNSSSNFGYLIPNYSGQQNPGVSQANSGGFVVGNPNFGNNFQQNPGNNNFQQNPGNNLQYDPNSIQRLPGQSLIGGNGVTTGDVIMAPNGQGVPLLVSADWVQNNRLTGQIKIIDASYNPSRSFVDYTTFQRQNMYGNFAQMSRQYTNQDYLNSHIVNSIYFNLDIATYPTRNQKYTLYPPNVFQNYVQSLGINVDDYLIVYSRDPLGGMRYAAAVWELFRIYNHTKISVLNGGFNAWTNRGYPVESGANQQQVATGNWIAGFDALKVITFEEMAAIQPNGKCYFNEPDLFNFLDTRSRVDFLQNGRLMCSKNFQIDQLINPNGTLVTSTQINVILARANYTRGQTSFVLDDDGPEASFGVLALAVVGDSLARLYNGGLNEIRQRSPAILVR